MTPRQSNTELEKAGQIDGSWRPEPMPDMARHIWRWYYEELRPLGPDPKLLSWTDLWSWSQLTQRHLSVFDVWLLRRLDVTCHAVRLNPNAFSSRKGDAPMSIEAIKTMFRSMAGGKEAGFL